MAEHADGAARPPVGAKAVISVTADRMEAEMTLQAPQNGGAKLTLKQLKEHLAEKGITTGIIEGALASLAESPVYDRSVAVAAGIIPSDGEDARLEYAFSIDRDLKPKERPDGSVDFKDLGLIEAVSKGQLLCTKRPLTAGSPGSDIYGGPIPAKDGKDCAIPAGKNTVLSDDKSALYSAIDGQADTVNGKVCVFDTYTVQGDVSPATGNVRFSGNVVITGGVPAGFAVQAAGNVDIGGVVEAAQITAGGSLIIRGGFSGGDGGSLDAGGNCTCRFIQGGKVTVGGDLETTYILNADVSCGASVNMTGKGLIVGGHVAALSSVTASTVGSASATPTVIEAGNSPGLLKRAQDIPREIESIDKNMQATGMQAKTLLQLKNAGRMTPDHAEQLKKSLGYLNRLKQLRADLELELEHARAQLELTGRGKVKVRKTAYVGVKLILGTEQFPLKTQYEFTSFSRTKDGVSCLPFS